MRYVRFGRTEAEVPAVSLGTWGHGGPKTAGNAPVGWGGNDDSDSVNALLRAFDAGITHWDTADVYGDGHAEELIGETWDRVARDKVFLATKVGWDPGPYGHFYHPEQIRRQMERSLRLLETDFVDLYYLHHCDFGPNDEYFEDALDSMRRLQDEGKFRFLGLSDWDSRAIMRYIDRVNPDVVQSYRNVVDDQYEESGLKSWIDRNDAGVAFFSPIKHGLLLGKYHEPPKLEEGDFRLQVPEFRDQTALDRMKRAAEEMRTRFASEREPVMHAVLGAILVDAPTGCVLLGQRTPRHVEAAAAVGGRMSDEDAAWVRKTYRGEVPSQS